jgi:hypothetical protein
VWLANYYFAHYSSEFPVLLHVGTLGDITGYFNVDGWRDIVENWDSPLGNK